MGADGLAGRPVQRDRIRGVDLRDDLGDEARAVLHGRYYVSCEDIRAVAAPVLRHRIITNFNAEAEGVKPDEIVRRLADVIPRDPNEATSP